MWNRAGIAPEGIEELTRLARLVKPEAVVWRGDANLSHDQQGVRILGVPICSAVFVQLEEKSAEQETYVRGNKGKFLAKQSRLQSVTTPTCGGASEPFWDQSELPTAPRLSPNCHSLLVDWG